MERVLNRNLSLHYLVGSDGAERHSDSSDSVVVSIADLCAFRLQKAYVGSLDIAEIFGWEGGVRKISVRMRLVHGEKFDLVICFGLTDPKHQAEVIKYIQTPQPLVVISGHPCIGFGHWCHLDRYIHPEI